MLGRTLMSRQGCSKHTGPMDSKRDWWKSHYWKYSSKPIPLPKGHKTPGHGKALTHQGVKSHSYFSLGQISWSAPTLSQSLCQAVMPTLLRNNWAPLCLWAMWNGREGRPWLLLERLLKSTQLLQLDLLSNLGGRLSKGCELGTTGCLPTRKWDSSQRKPVWWVGWGDISNLPHK